MPDPSHGAADPALSVSADTPASAPEPLPPSEGSGSALAEGGRWRTYRIGKQVGNCYVATDTTAMEEVLLHSRPIGDRTEMRRETWERLLAAAPSGLVAPREAHEEAGRRYEVFSLPVGVTLRDWVTRGRPEQSEIESVVQQVAAELDALHAAGVVHLQVHSQTIFIEDEGGGLRARLGGLEAATLFDQKELVPIPVNPFWAPPEAAGLYQHKPGVGLCAWDWWALGRVVQEILHNGHVFGKVFGRDVTAEPHEFRHRAEAILLERDVSGVRAGAAELLPEDTDARMRALVRGLVTTVRDGRWRGEEIQRWLQSGTGPDRYDLPRDARLFWWRRQAFTVPEAAAFFLQPDYAYDGLKQLFPLATGKGDTMREFLEDTPSLRDEHVRVTQILGYVDSLPWQQFALNARRAAVSGLAWRTLAGAEGPVLSVQRWPITPSGMQEMFSDAPPTESLALARAMAVTAYRRAVEAVDAAAGRTLALLAETGFEALNQAVARGWAEAGADETHARLLWFAFETDAELQTRRERLKAAYATVRDPAMQALFDKERPTRTELVLLAFLAENARDFGFVTHGEWTTERVTTLREGAVRARTAVFWTRAGKLLLLGQSVLGAWPVFFAIWLPAVAILSTAGGWVWGLALGAFALLLRLLAWIFLRLLVDRFGIGTWRLADGVRRAQAEAAAAAEKLTAEERADALKAFAAANSGLQQVSPDAAPLGAPPRFAGLWVLVGLAQLVPIAICLAPLLNVDLARERTSVEVKRHLAKPVLSLGPGNTLYEVTDDGFGPRKRGPLRHWDVPAAEPRPMLVQDARPASPNQRAYARVGGELLLEPYPRFDLKLTLAVPVQHDGSPSIVLYDTDTRELADERAFQLREAPVEKTWYWIGNRRVVYLGVPTRLPAQNSLAQP